MTPANRNDAKGIVGMRRTVTAALISALLVLTIGACGKKPHSKALDKPYNATIVLGFSQVGAESAWRVANTESIRDAAAGNNIELIFNDARGKQGNQINAIRSFIARKVDVIAFSPVVETGWDPVLAEAKAAHIPVIVTDRNITTADQSLFLAALGSDFLSEGDRAAAYLIQEYSDKKGPIKVVEIEGGKGSGPAVQRKKGFDETLSADPRFTIVDSVAGDWTRARGQRLMKDLLAEHPGVDAVFAHNDDMGLGALTAIQAADKTPGVDIKVVTVDATKEALQKLAAGKMNVVVECNPLIGPPLIDMVIQNFFGGYVAKQTYVKESVFRQADVKDFLDARRY
jgi:ABC-type sugar transport system substrate-binding protein